MRTASDSEVRAIVREGFFRSLVSLLIKLATAGLTYLMFVVLTRALGATEYGLFALGFSLATMLAIAAGMGQQTAILRYWPEEIGKNDRLRAVWALQSGWALVLMAGIGLACAGAAGVLVYGLFRQEGILGGMGHVLAGCALILPLAAAEYGSSVLRAQGSVWTALLPRDILWRLSVVAGGGALLVLGVSISGALALGLVALLLGVALVAQGVAGRLCGFDNSVRFAGLGAYWREHGAASRWFMVGTVVDSMALYADVVLVGLFVTADSAGLYFNAMRTAGLMTLFMFATTLVIAPMVARHFHGNDLRMAQAVTSLCAWAGFLFSAGVFCTYVFFGDFILSLFGAPYANGHLILVILSLGLLADAATGPTRTVMMMTGHERAYVRLFGSIMIVGMAAQLVVIPLFGLVGAALVNAGTRIVAQGVIALWTRRHVGIDGSIFSFGRLPRPMGG